MAPLPPQFSAVKLQSYLLRIPFFTRLIIFIILILSIVNNQSVLNIQEWCALTPRKIGLTSMYRTNTYPLVHTGPIHAISNIIALTPLLQRFEVEYGTLMTLALFFGRMPKSNTHLQVIFVISTLTNLLALSSFPALFYTCIERGILRMNTSILGASIWVFTLLAIEAVKTYKINPYFMLGTTPIPTWITPVILALFVSFLIPNTSFLGHLCGLAFGYGWGLGYLQFSAPPQWVLKWTEGNFEFLGKLPHYISVDQKIHGRFGVLPSVNQNLV